MTAEVQSFPVLSATGRRLIRSFLSFCLPTLMTKTRCRIVSQCTTTLDSSVSQRFADTQTKVQARVESLGNGRGDDCIGDGDSG